MERFLFNAKEVAKQLSELRNKQQVSIRKN